MDIYEHPGYLSRADKIFFVVALIVMIPLTLVGWPYLAAALLAIGPFWLIFHAIANRHRKAQADVGAHVNFSKLVKKPKRIRHHSTRFPNS